MLDTTQIPAGALSDVRQFVRDNNLVRPSDHSKEACDAHIATMSPEEFLDAYLMWNGIIGYTDSIVSVLDAARKAESKPHPADNREVVGVYGGRPRIVRYVASGGFWFDEASCKRVVDPDYWRDAL